MKNVSNATIQFNSQNNDHRIVNKLDLMWCLEPIISFRYENNICICLYNYKISKAWYIQFCEQTVYMNVPKPGANNSCCFFEFPERDIVRYVRKSFSYYYRRIRYTTYKMKTRTVVFKQCTLNNIGKFWLW